MLALRVILSLAAVVAVLWLAQRKVTSHQTRSRKGEALTVVARRGVGSKAAVVLVDTGGQRFLLGVTEQAVNVLHTGDAPVEEPAAEPVPAAPAAGAGAFAAVLAGLTGPGAAATGLRRRELQMPGTGPLAGSILDPGTWKQAFAVMGKGLSR